MYLTKGLRRAAKIRPRKESTVFGDRRRTLAETADRVARKDVFMRLATVLETELGDLSRAEEVLGQILNFDSEDADALAFLDRVYDKHGDF